MKTSVWDAADSLNTAEDITAFLEAVFEDGDPALIAAAIGDVARSKGMTEVARKTGFSRESLYKALSESGNPSFGTILQVLQSLGLRLEAKAIKAP
jgi:probable addiction module antidote protein